MNKEELIELKELAKDFSKSVEKLTVEEANELLKKKSNEKILQERIDKALFNIQRIIDYGFDYDGFNKVESLKSLIDMLVGYAKKTKDILKGSDTNVKNQR